MKIKSWNKDTLKHHNEMKQSLYKLLILVYTTEEKKNYQNTRKLILKKL